MFESRIIGIAKMSQSSYIIITVLIVLGIFATYFHSIWKRINLESWLKDQGFIKIKAKELDPQLKPLLKIRFPKLLVEGVYSDRVCVLAFTESSSSDGDGRVTVSTNAIQSAIDWPKITIQPINSLNRLCRNRVKSGNKAIDKHWNITCAEEKFAKCVIECMHHELLDVPAVMKSFRISSNQDTDRHSRFEFVGHWIVMAKQVSGYKIHETEESLTSLKRWVQQFEAAVTDIESAE